VDGTARLENSVRDCLRSLAGIESGLVVAVSGGPDSVALLRLMLAVRDPSMSVTIAHLNHLLRGTESDADEEFVVRLHAALSATVPNVGLRTDRLDVTALARANADNLEAAARSARYRWLLESARAVRARWVATGHTANDQAETVLHRLIRGTGLQGLRGIAERRALDAETCVIRPLLPVPRDELLAYLHGLGQDFREDSTNQDPRFTRNRIRSELLPLLAAHYNPATVSVLANLAEQAVEAHRFEEAAAAALLREAELPRAGSTLVFDAARLARAPRLLVRVLFRLVWAREGWPTGRMDFAAWERLAGLVFDGTGGGDFPGGVHVRRSDRVIQLDTLPTR
jgi:tRNA(Ile)-lysidine synthase